MLVSNLSGITDRAAFNDSKSTSNDEEKNKALKCVEKLVFDNTHDTIKAILKVTPLASRAALIQVSFVHMFLRLKKIHYIWLYNRSSQHLINNV